MTIVQAIFSHVEPSSPPRGFTQPESQTCTFEGPGLQKHHQNSTKAPTREGEKNENCGGRGKKENEILGGPAEGGPAEGLGFGVKSSGQRFLWTKKQKQNKKKKKKQKETKTRKSRKRRIRANTICSTSANFDFGQFRLWPISTSATSISASWPKSNWPKSKLAKVEHPPF